MRSIKTCARCGLQDSFPGISFGDNGQCKFCQKYKDNTSSQESKDAYLAKFIEMIDKTKDTGPYDAVVAYSGGKDSTYTLKILIEKFHLNLLAITFDHGFVSQTTQTNIKLVTEALQIDHQTVRPAVGPLYKLFNKSLQPGIYPIKALTRASAICNTCMNLVKSYLLKTAIESGIPMVAYGWSPGQASTYASIFQTNAQILRQMQSAAIRPFGHDEIVPLSPFYLQDRHLEATNFPTIIHPLAFLPYDEEMIIEEIGQLGWQKPDRTDANSTNCLLNSYANERHINDYGFHPYSLEISTLVREGYMTREEGLKKINSQIDPDVTAEVKKTFEAHL